MAPGLGFPGARVPRGWEQYKQTRIGANSFPPISSENQITPLPGTLTCVAGVSLIWILVITTSCLYTIP